MIFFVFLFFVLEEAAKEPDGFLHNSRVTFKAQLKVGWQPKYYIECYIPKCWSYTEVCESARNK